MSYVVCQTPKCQQTYPVSDFQPTDTDIKCEKCNGTLIDKNGHANFSQNPWVIPVITTEEIEQNQEKQLNAKRQELDALQSEIHELESSV